MKTWADFGIDLPQTGGAERYTTCPQCSPQRRNKRAKCLSVNIDKEVWCCHHCGWTGTLKSGADRVRTPLHWQAPTYRQPDYQVAPITQQSVWDWFARRGISREVVERNQISVGSVYMPQLEDWVNAIRFPFLRQGQAVNIKYRDTNKNFRMEARCERILYGLDDIDELTVVVEGELDKLAVEQAGIRACVSVPDGAPSPETKDYSSKFDYLGNCESELAKVKQFVIAVDADAPGQRLEQELLHRLGRYRCAIVRWPDGVKDANEMLLKHGAEALQLAIYSAEPPPVEGVVRVSDLMDKLQRLYAQGMAPGVQLPWRSLQDLYRVSLGEWTLVTGIPGHGKSEFLDAMLVSLAQEHDWCFGFYSPENYPLEQHVAKLIEKRVGKPFRGQLEKMSAEEMTRGAAWVNHHFHFLRPGEESLSLEAVLELCAQVILRDGIRGLVIDPWNELEHERPQHLTETEYTSRCLTKIRQFARTHNIHIWVVAHPTKLTKDVKGNYPVPTPYDVSGSAHWRNKADNAIAVWRDASKNDPVQVHIQKIRFKKNGKVGKALLVYDTLTGRFKDVPEAVADFLSKAAS